MSGSGTNRALGERHRNVIPAAHVSIHGSYIERGEGARLYDVEGREYIDFAGGIAVMNVGHSHPKVVEAVCEQARKLTHTCFMVLPYEPAVTLAEKLVATVPGSFEKRVLFVNSGAEAVENAVKVARYATKRPAVLCFENAFHGRTLLTMTLTSKIKPYKYGFGPYAPEIYRLPFAYCYRCALGMEYPACHVACADLLEEFFVTHVAAESTAALIVEPVLGEGGFIVPPPEYFPKLKKICEKYGIVFIADEIQTGMGRTGTMFAMEHWGVEAEITTVAKSLAAGMPLSAVVGREDLMNAVHPGGLGGTYGGNPVACAAALAVFQVIETEGVLERARRLGEVVRSRLEAFQNDFEVIGEVRGLGPMLAMELVEDRETRKPAAEAAKKLVQFCFQRGLILLSCGSYGNVIRLMMPLVIEDELLERGLAIMEEGFRSLQQS